MTEERLDADVVVVGAGAAGSAAALQLRHAGRETLLLDSLPIGSAGAGWANVIPAWMFERAGVPLPEPPELLARDVAVHFLASNGPARVTVRGARVLHVDMRLLCDRLHSIAAEAGVKVMDRAGAISVECQGGRPVAIVVGVEGGEPDRVRVTARLFVDASGLTAVLRRQVPLLDAACPPVLPEQLCSAAQETCEVEDREGAAAFLRRVGIPPGEAFGWSGLNGGFSTLSAYVDPDMRSIGVVAGVTANGRHGSGPSVLRAFKEAEPWIGRGVSGGAGLIPIRRPYDRLGSEGIALLGDAACQTFPGHASGTGIGMIAARILSEAVAGRPDPGSREATWAYQHAFHKEFGGLLAAYDAFRRFVQSRPGEDVNWLSSSGVMREGMMAAAIEQRFAIPGVGEAAAVIETLASRGSLVSGLLDTAARMGALSLAYSLHPAGPDQTLLGIWSRSVAALLGACCE